MKFLFDVSQNDWRRLTNLCAGQLLTPLTNYANWDDDLPFAIDNGGFKGVPVEAFARILSRNKPHIDRCLFVVVPDIVGSAQRTLELFQHRHHWIGPAWPLAFVAQNGSEDIDIPWDDFDALFLGGLDPWKDSRAAVDVVKTAKLLGKHVHIGRVNTDARYKKYAYLGADTCDGSGVCRYDHMLPNIEAGLNQPLFEDQ